MSLILHIKAENNVFEIDLTAAVGGIQHFDDAPIYMLVVPTYVELIAKKDTAKNQFVYANVMRYDVEDQRLSCVASPYGSDEDLEIFDLNVTACTYMESFPIPDGAKPEKIKLPERPRKVS